MNVSAQQLRELQTWMQALIVRPGDDTDSAIRKIILPSQKLSSEQRLEIYHAAYYSRLLECLREFFPALTAAIGSETFDVFAFQYLQQFPPQSYTLNRLADQFVTFLEATKPVVDDNTTASWADFVIDLARLEWAIDDIFDGPGVEQRPTLSAAELATISPEAWSDIVLVPAPSLRLLDFQFPINDVFSAHRQGAPIELPAPSPTWLALQRREFVVRRYELTHDQFLLLQQIVSGNSLGNAVEAVARQSADFAGFANSLSHWFRDWSAEQFFVRATKGNWEKL